MTMRQRKLVGGIGLIVGLIAYVFAVSIAVTEFVSDILWLELLIYAVAGVAWALPVRFLILWMNRPDPE